MKDSRFDNAFRETLYSHSSSVDSEKIWKNVEAGLPGRRKIGNWIFWLSAFLLVFFVSGIVYMSLPGKKENRKMEMDQIGESMTPGSASEISGRTQTDHIRNISGERQIQFTENDSPDSLIRHTNIPANSGPTNASAPSATLPDRVENPSTKRPESMVTTKIVDDPSQTANDLFLANKKNSLNELSPSNEVHGWSGDMDSSKALTISLANSPETESHFTTGHSDRKLTGAELIVLEPINIKFDQIPGQLLLPEKNDLTRPELKTDQQNSRFFLQMSAGAGVIDRTILSLHTDYNQYVAQRSQTERPLEFQSVQGSFGYYFRDGLYISGGLNMTAINEHFLLDRDRVTTHEQTITTHIHVNADGDSVIQTGTVITTLHHSEHISHFNKYTLIDIPVFLGYERSFNRWTAGVEAGILWNLSLRTRGTMLTVGDEVVRMEDSDAFHNQLNQNYAINLRLGYALSERLSFHLAPGVRFIHRSVLTIDQIDQHYRLWGLQGGLIYRFP